MSAATGVTRLAELARAAWPSLALASSAQKNAVLLAIAQGLRALQGSVLAANAQDVQTAQAAGMSAALLDRLRLDATRLEGIACDVERVAALPDPIGETFEQGVLDNGLVVHKQRVPLGVIGVIYEARPNVSIDCAALAIKSGNAAILRGSADTLASNRALVSIVHSALVAHGLPPATIAFVDDADRSAVGELLSLSELVDLIIPRGGAALHARCRAHSKIPVITGGIGICHLYVAASADIPAALRVIENAKVQRPSVCNALDTVLVDATVADRVVPQVVARLAPLGVRFKACERAIVSVADDPAVDAAGRDDFDTEWLSLTLGIKVVDGLDAAIAHIAAHSSGHSDGILGAVDAEAAEFIRRVDSAAVYHNASTRFTDGSALGLGAEIAISTQRVHARGPMALVALTSYKWIIRGDYHVRG